MTDIAQIPVAALDDFWPHVWPSLQHGLAVAGKERHEIAADILADRARVWIATAGEPVRVKAAWLTEVTNDGQRRLVVFGLGGADPKDWIADLEQEMLAFARAEKCATVRFAGRRGWVRLLPDCRQIGQFGGEPIFERAVA